MAANPFDQFDTAQTANPFDQFDVVPMQTGTGVDAIPGQRSISKKEAPVSMRDRIMGVIETPAVLAGGLASSVAAPVAALYGELTSPAPQGSAQARAAGEAMAAKAREQFYQPRTQTSQQIMGVVAPVFEAIGAIPSVNAMQMGQAAGPAMAATKNKLRAVADAPIPFGETVEAGAARVQAERVADSTRNAPRIEAAQAARKYDIAVNPAEANPTKGNKVKAVLAGNKGLDAQFSLDNVEKFNAAAAKEMGLPENTPLTKPAFTEARNLASGPYRAVEQLPVLDAPAEVLSKVQKLKGDPSLIGGATSNAEIAKLVDDAQSHITAGMAGDEILKNIRQMRSKAQRAYKSAGATPDQIDVADARMGIANALEDLIDSNIQDPKLLSDFRKARVAMAKTYAYEAATDLNTGNLDPQAIAKITAASNELTGTIADIGKIAGNFPSVSQGTNVSYSALPTLTRSGLGGSVGYALGSTVGMPLQGSIAGAGIGGLAGRIAAKRMGTPEYQAANAVPTDYRPPVNNLRPADINYGPNQLVPYDFRQATLTPDQMPYRPNWTLGRGTPDVTVSAPPAGPAQLPAPSAEGTMGMVQNRRQFDYNMQKALDEQAAARAEAEAAANRAPTKGGVELQINPLTGGAEVSKGLKGATPDTFQNYGTSLASAAEKVTSGKMFDMTLAEKAAWKNTRADLAEVTKGLEKLDDKAVAAKMMDRKWAQDALDKAREKAQMFDDLARRMEGEQARRDAAIKRDQMLDLAAMLEDNMRAPRPVSSGGQGPKTREFRRNQLAQDRENKNALRIEIRGVGQKD